MKRLFDIIFALLLIVLFSLPMIILAFVVKLTSSGSVFYWSTRIGKLNAPFQMPKFRTMRINTPELPTHQLENPNEYLTSVGAFLRKTSLDELPQLFSILKGDMCFVGPRPALHNQEDLITLRTKQNIHTLTPGVTGLAQINGRDDLSVEEKVALDAQYLQKQSLLLDLSILYQTLAKVIKKEGIQH